MVLGPGGNAFDVFVPGAVQHVAPLPYLAKNVDARQLPNICKLEGSGVLNITHWVQSMGRNFSMPELS